ncbi:MAG: class I SAM-dependent methyltransferase [Rhizomicrobium sp.]
MAQINPASRPAGLSPKDAPAMMSIETADAYPGFGKVSHYMQTEIVRRGAHAVADIGGGANPVLPREFIEQQNVDYAVIDISADELAKAPAAYKKFCVDIAARAEIFDEALDGKRFDLIFSHMVLEHVRDAKAAHRNILNALRPGGVAIHMFPTANNIPLFLNRLLPEWLTHAAVRIMQPDRDVEGHQVKFPAYYRLCNAPSSRTKRKFAALGFEVERHSGYIGHSYYAVLPLLRRAEMAMRPILANAGIPMTSTALLILRKPARDPAVTSA